MSEEINKILDLADKDFWLRKKSGSRGSQIQGMLERAQAYRELAEEVWHDSKKMDEADREIRRCEQARRVSIPEDPRNN